MRRATRKLSTTAITLLVCASLAHRIQGQDSQRIIALGDVHGDLAGLTAILQEAGLVDAQSRWSGGTDVLVQTGDLIDRGPNDRAVLDFMMRLQKEASQAGGEVVCLLGNHEVMNLYGDLRYVAPETYASFIDEKSEKRQQEFFKKHVRHQNQLARRLRSSDLEVTPEWEQQWHQAHPLGYVEHREHFDRKGNYGRWLRELPTVAQIEGYVFLHGGISPDLSGLSVKEINKRIRNEIKGFDVYRGSLEGRGVILSEFTLREVMQAVADELTFENSRSAVDFATNHNNLAAARAQQEQYRHFLSTILEYGQWFSVHPNGPLWFRGYANWSEQEGQAEIAKLSESYGAAAFIVGHTPQLGQGIQSRFNGQVVLIDTGLLSSYYHGGEPSALVIKGERLEALYLGRKLPLGEKPVHASN